MPVSGTSAAASLRALIAALEQLMAPTPEPPSLEAGGAGDRQVLRMLQAMTADGASVEQLLTSPQVQERFQVRAA